MKKKKRREGKKEGKIVHRVRVVQNCIGGLGTNWRASEASETLIGLNNGNWRYIYIVRETSL